MSQSGPTSIIFFLLFLLLFCIWLQTFQIFYIWWHRMVMLFCYIIMFFCTLLHDFDDHDRWRHKSLFSRHFCCCCWLMPKKRGYYRHLTVWSKNVRERRRKRIKSCNIYNFIIIPISRSLNVHSSLIADEMRWEMKLEKNIII